jgi:glycine cleavage system H lipoate-binding protein
MGSDLPCVWMSAGVLSYRLCDREYECESCPLHQALIGGAKDALPPEVATSAGSDSAGDDPIGRFLSALGAGCTLRLDRPHSAEGLWLQSEPTGTLRVGLDDYTLRLLQPVADVVLPKVGTWLRHGAPCAWIHRGRLAIVLHSPLAGEVVEVHPCPVLAPPAGGEDAEGRWWFRLNPHETLGMATGLRRNEALLDWFVGRVRAVHAQANAAMRPSAAGAVGAALADGGMPSDDLEMVLGRERFEALVGTLFPL